MLMIIVLIINMKSESQFARASVPETPPYRCAACR